jgi:hypothetical protein
LFQKNTDNKNNLVGTNWTSNTWTFKFIDKSIVDLVITSYGGEYTSPGKYSYKAPNIIITIEGGGGAYSAKGTVIGNKMAVTFDGDNYITTFTKE